MTDRDPALDAAPGGGDPQLYDPHLKRALAQAPDRAELPDWQLRQRILAHAHAAVSDAEALLAASRARTGWGAVGAWWRGRGKGGRRTTAMPWAGALATVVVAVLVTLLWQREPVPGARPEADRPAPAAGREQKAPQPARHEGFAAPPATPGASAPAEEAPGADTERAREKRDSDELRERPFHPSSQPHASVAEPAPAPASAPIPQQPLPAQGPAADAVAPPSEPQSEAQSLSPSQLQRLAQAQSPMPAAVPPATPPAAIAPPSTGTPAAGLPGGAASASGPAAAPAASPEPDSAERAAQSATAKNSAVAAAASGASMGAGASMAKPQLANVQPSPAAPSPEGATPPAHYVSLARWTALRIANVSGQIRVVPRADAGELVALLESAAAQPAGDEALRELPQWRVVLEGEGRNRGAMLAVLEVGRSQMRWTEGAGAPVTSRPPPAALDALHAALREALRAPPARTRKP